MAPNGDRPARRRLTEEELRAAFAHAWPTLGAVQHVTGHDSLQVLLAYRREAQAARDNPARGTLFGAARQARRPGMSPRQIADAVTGHRGAGTVAQYVRRSGSAGEDADTQ